MVNRADSQQGIPVLQKDTGWKLRNLIQLAIAKQPLLPLAGHRA